MTGDVRVQKFCCLEKSSADVEFSRITGSRDCSEGTLRLIAGQKYWLPHLIQCVLIRVIHTCHEGFTFCKFLRSRVFMGQCLPIAAKTNQQIWIVLQWFPISLDNYVDFKLTRDCKFKRWLMRPYPISETPRKLLKLLNLLMKISLLCNLSTWASVEMRMSVSFAFMMERGKSDISTRLTTLVSASSWSHLRASSWATVSLFVLMSVGFSNTPLTVMVYVCGTFWIKYVPTRIWTCCLLTASESNSFISSWSDGS